MTRLFPRLLVPLLLGCAVAAPAAPGSGLRLLATFVHADPAHSLAIIASDSSTLTLRAGQSLEDGLSVQAIEPRRVLLARGQQRYPLPLAGRPPAQRQPASLPPRTVPANTLSNTGAPISAGITPSLQGSTQDDIRAACADATVMAALSEAHKAELDALGLCSTR